MEENKILNAHQLKQVILLMTYETLEQVVYIIKSSIANKENEEAITFAVSNLLSNAKSRVMGLELLSEIIPYISLNVLTLNAVRWASHCMVHHSNDNTKDIKLKTLAKIIEATADIESLNKKFLSEHLSDALKTCLSVQNRTEKSAALKCLIPCIQRFPSWFGNHKSKVEPFLLKYLESTVQSEVKAAAIAFHYCQQTGSAGIDGINYVNNFSSTLNKLCATLHVLYDEFFENVDDIDDTEKVDAVAYTFTPLPSHFGAEQVIEATTNKILNLLTFIKTFLVKKYPVVKNVVPKYVVDAITRGLSLHICLGEGDGSLLINLQSMLLNKIQIQLLQLLRIFITGYLPSVFQFSHLLNKFLLNTIKRTQDCECFTTDVKYCEKVYKTFADWLTFTGNGNQSQLQEYLIPLLLKDISPMKKKVLLNLNISGKKTKGKKRAVAVSTEPTEEKVLYGAANMLKEKRCQGGLSILQSLLNTSSLRINQQLEQELITFVVKTLCDIQTGRSVSPYTEITCIKKLYEVLISFFKQNNVKSLPPLHQAAVILKRGSTHFNHNISRVCKNGLDLLETISQPVCVSLCVYELPLISGQQIINNSELNDINDVDNAIDELSDEHDIDIPRNQEEAVVVEEEDININDISSDSVEEHICENSEKHEIEPPAKKRKEDDALDDMFSSFKDVVQ